MDAISLLHKRPEKAQTPCHPFSSFAGWGVWANPPRTENTLPKGHNPRTQNGHRRRQLRARVLREEDHCWMCGRYVDKDLPPSHPYSAEVDELLPVSRGGSPYDRENCRLACRTCNRKRGNGMRYAPRQYVPPFTAGQSAGS